MFNWNKNRDAIVFRSSAGVAVYANTYNDIVIRQEAYPAKDSIVIIPREKAESFLDAIRRLTESEGAS